MTHRPHVPGNLDELQLLVAQGEHRHVEFKELVGGRSATRKVVQAVAAMANLREGGLVVLGVDDRRVVKGLSATELSHWGKRDHAMSTVNAALDPAVDLKPHVIGHCVVLEVLPFARTPIIVRVSKGASDQPDGLVEGVLYYRSSVVTSSTAIARLEDWVELRETLLLRAQAGAKRLDEEHARIARAAEEDRIREVLRAARTAVFPASRKGKEIRGFFGLVAGNFRLAQIRSQQSEAKANLKAAYTAFRAYFQETDRFPPSLGDAGFEPHSGGRYVYRAIDGELVGAEQRSDRPELVAEGLRELARFGGTPHISERDFLVMAVTRFEREALLDVWIIDRFGDPRCLTPETTDVEERKRKERWDALFANATSRVNAVK